MKAISVKVLKDNCVSAVVLKNKCWLKDTRAVLRVNLSDGTYTDTLVCPVSYDGQVATFEETVTVPNLLTMFPNPIDPTGFTRTINGGNIIYTQTSNYSNKFISDREIFKDSYTSQNMDFVITASATNTNSLNGDCIILPACVSNGSIKYGDSFIGKNGKLTAKFNLNYPNVTKIFLAIYPRYFEGTTEVGYISTFSDIRITADPRPSWATYITTVQILSPDKQEVLETIDGSSWLNGTDHTITGTFPFIETITLQDTHISDNTARELYYNKSAGGFINQAQAVYTEYESQLSDKICNATNLNNFVDNVNNLESIYFNNTENYANTLNNNMQTFIDNYSFKGAYSSTTTYVYNNVVSYNNQLWICIAQSTTNVAPSNVLPWKVINNIGKSGDYASGVTYVGQWNATTTYSAKSMVAWNGRLYIAVSSNTGVQPTIYDSTTWTLVTIPSYDIEMSTVQPTNQGYGCLWFDITTPPLVAIQRVTLSDGTITDTNIYSTSIVNNKATFDWAVTTPNLVDFTKMNVITNNSPQYVITTNGIKITSTVALNPINSWVFVYVRTKTSQIIPSGTTCTYSCDFTSSVDTCGGRIYGFNTNVSTGSPNVQSATLTKTVTLTSDIDISKQEFGGSNYYASSTSTSGSIAVGDIMDFQNWRITADPRPSFATYVSTVQILSADATKTYATIDGSSWLNGTDQSGTITANI